MGNKNIYFEDLRLKSILKGLYAAYVPYNYRLSRTFRKTTSFLCDSEYWSRERIHTHQSKQLRKLVLHAYQHVPWYRRKYDSEQIDISSINGADDLCRLPFLNKVDVKNAMENDFCASNLKRDRLVKVMSGGTTGSPASFYHLKGYSDGIFDAYRIRAWEMSGYRPNARALDLTWAFSGARLRFNPYMNWLSYSISSLGPGFFEEDFEKIRKFAPKFIIGYPSSVTMFAELVREQKMGELAVDGIITGSEMLYSSQHEIISETFNCRISEWYGLSELAGFAAFCETSDHYHFFPQAGCVELIDDSGAYITKEGEEGEIVLTGFHTYATPFIRYRTGDRGIRGGDRCDKCGRNYPIIKKIIGREQDYILSRGSKVPLSGLNCHADIFQHVWKYQFYQERLGAVTLRLVPKPTFNEEDFKAICSLLEQKLGNSFQWNIVQVGDIQSTSRGKHKFLVQDFKH